MCNISDLIEEQATKRGLEKGLQQGETKLGKLISALLKDGLTNAVERVAVDEEIRAEYYKKYNIDQSMIKPQAYVLRFFCNYPYLY